MAENFLEYKGRPLVRSGNMIFYGNLADEFVIMMLINSVKTVNGKEVADKISIIGSVGIQLRISTIRMIRLSTHPPTYPASPPRITPIIDSKMITTKPIVREILPPIKRLVKISKLLRISIRPL